MPVLNSYKVLGSLALVDAHFVSIFRLFNETPVNPRKCIAVLTKILYLINQGEVLGTSEATECFFAITKLFQVGAGLVGWKSGIILRKGACIKGFRKKGYF